MNARDLEEALEMGMDWSLREGMHIFLTKLHFTVTITTLYIYL